MKTYTIGRDSNSDIYIDNKMISRRHALLKVFPSGKMQLVDMSANGTYVNGTKLKPNSPMPLSRKDSVSFAHVSTLDWKLVDNPLKWIKWSLIGIAGVAVVICLVVFLTRQCSDDGYVLPSTDGCVSDTVKHKTSISKSDKKKIPDSDLNDKQEIKGKDVAKKKESKEKPDWVKNTLEKAKSHKKKDAPKPESKKEENKSTEPSEPKTELEKTEQEAPSDISVII